LLTGKTTLSYINEIDYLIANNYATDPKYVTNSFAKNACKKETVNFILNKLK